MAAVTRNGRARVAVRAARPGEGASVAALWRELWDAHEMWGGYAGSKDAAVYERLAARLDDDARARAGQPVIGRHLHVIATVDGTIAGQVEGWMERHGIDPRETPYTCEVRSLIVTSWARKAGVGRALLDGLGEAAAGLVREGSLVLGAEVLEPNPAHAFYARLGYQPVSWSVRTPSSAAATVPASHRPDRHAGGPLLARSAEPRDALAMCILDAALAARRRAQGDTRYDRPRAVDAASVAAIAAHLGEGVTSLPGTSSDLVTVDAQGRVRASATFAVTPLDPPFRAGHRAVLGRFAADPAVDAAPLVAPLIAYAQRVAHQAGAATVELTDLPPPGSALHQAAMASGGMPWSRIVTKGLSVRMPG
jgi:GNAT superfamily N-acetyltransferase